MAIPEHLRANFQTLLRAAGADDLALVECEDSTTSEPRYVVCAVARDGDTYVLTPLGHLADGDPYALYRPPSIDGPTSAA